MDNASLAVISGIGIAIIAFLFLIYKKLDSPSAGSNDSDIGKKLGELNEKVARIFDPDNGELSRMHKSIESFQKTIRGTSTRGQVGERLLKERLKPFIESGQIKTDVKLDGGVVEFAWKLPHGKYIPIDSKLPEVDDLIKEFESTDDDNRKRIGKQITDKIKKQISNVTKYQNTSRTIDRCVLVVPAGILDVSPELIDEGASKGVIVCSFETVYVHVFLLAREYEIINEKGDVGKYKKIIEQYQGIIIQVQEKTETIQRGMTTIEGANDSIRKSVGKSHKLE